MAGRTAYQVHIVNPAYSTDSYDLFRTKEAAEEFAQEYLLKAGKANPVALRDIEVEVTGPFEV